MKTKLVFFSSFILACCLVGCTETEQQAKEIAQGPSVERDARNWEAYFTQIVNGQISDSNNVYVYILPKSDSKDFKPLRAMKLAHARADLERGDMEGALLVFASPDSVATAEFMQVTLQGVGSNQLAGNRILFIGSDEERIKVSQVVEKTGAVFVFEALQ